MELEDLVIRMSILPKMIYGLTAIPAKFQLYFYRNRKTQTKWIMNSQNNFEKQKK
jgi:hypothetical protein